MSFEKIKAKLPQVDLKHDFCTNKLNAYKIGFTKRVDYRGPIRNFAAGAAIATLALTAIAILKVVAPIFDAFINLALDLKNPQGKSRLVIGLTFPVDLSIKVGRTFLNVGYALMTPFDCIINFSQRRCPII